MTPGEVLLGAADYLETHGICRDRLQDDDGRMCLVRAMSAVSVDFDLYYEASRQLKIHLGLNQRPLVQWFLAQSDSDVIAALRAAAKLQHYAQAARGEKPS